jgi:hypothetical protein
MPASQNMEQKAYEHTASLVVQMFDASMLANTPPHSFSVCLTRNSDLIDVTVSAPSRYLLLEDKHLCSIMLGLLVAHFVEQTRLEGYHRMKGD